jgi:hypothetical protein
MRRISPHPSRRNGNAPLRADLKGQPVGAHMGAMRNRSIARRKTHFLAECGSSATPGCASVVQRLCEAHPELRCKQMSRRGDRAKDLPYRFALFESTIEGDGLYLTEDKLKHLYPSI